MGHKFAELAFTTNVKAEQTAQGSRRAYERFEKGEDHHDVLGPSEAAFIARRDSFYMASVGETGWPYVQHRGGPAGFLKVLDDKSIGFADFRGNRQYVSVGNLRADDRVSLFLMDYENQNSTENSWSRPYRQFKRSRDLATASASRLPRAGRTRHSHLDCSVRLELSATHYAAIHIGGNRGRYSAAAEAD